MLDGLERQLGHSALSGLVGLCRNCFLASCSILIGDLTDDELGIAVNF